MTIDDFRFPAGGQQLAATRRRADDGAVHVLTLHGLGTTATRHTIGYVLDDLCAHGHGSVCFEFSGNGDSTGVLKEASLGRRRREALAAAEHLDARRAPVLIGTSMGAHLAASLVPALRPSGLVLFCPAAYPASAIDQPFDDAFARPGPHPDSPAFAGLREFDGDLLVVGAREDHVVSAQTVEAYLASATRARRRELIWLDGCDHFIHRWLPHQAGPKDEVAAAIRRVAGAPSAAR